MCGVLALLFLAVPAVELAVLLFVGDAIGAWPTLALVALMAVAGAYLARRQGLAALRDLQASLVRGQAVGAAATEAALILAAGILLLTPGFVSDVVGIALLIGPVRRPLAAALARRWAARAVAATVRPPWERRGGPEDPPPPGVIDV